MSKSLHHHIVARARTIIEDEEHWTQDMLAVAKDGTVAEPTDDRAYRFCAVGALTRAAADLTGDIAGADILANHIHLAILRSIDMPAGATLEAINDGDEGHAAILKLFDDYLSVQ
jgi:hypothetical protein